MKFGDLTFQEIRGRAEEGWLAVVPTGCTEQQGQAVVEEVALIFREISARPLT